ncbi:histone H1-like [Tachysurus ichikawai]
MAEVAPAPTAAPAKAAKKKAASGTKKTGPSMCELIVKAFSSSKERSGGLVTKDTLVQTKGTGASGSFKLNKKETEVKKPTKKAAPKATKVALKKPAAAKKPKKKATKSPKKAKMPATPKKAAKRAKKPATPKKVKAVKPKTTKPKSLKAKKAPKKK